MHNFLKKKIDDYGRRDLVNSEADWQIIEPLASQLTTILLQETDDDDA